MLCPDHLTRPYILDQPAPNSPATLLAQYTAPDLSVAYHPAVREGQTEALRSLPYGRGTRPVT